MNIDIEKYPVVEGVCKVTGQYLYKSKRDPKERWALCVKDSLEAFFPNMEYRGPVTFGPFEPHLDLSSLDLSKYPVVDKPDRVGLWRFIDEASVERYMTVEQRLIDCNAYVKAKWQRVADFTPPAPVVLPPVPETTIYLVRCKDRRREWCRKNERGYWLHGSERLFCDLENGTELATRTLAAKEVV